MGFASSSREVKLKMMKTSHTRKTTRKLNRLARRKKLSRNVIDGLKDIKARRSKESRKRVLNIEDDWIDDRNVHYGDEAEDNLPLDMLDADVDWENSAFAGVVRRRNRNYFNIELEHPCSREDDGDIEKKKRKFEGHLDDNLEEMLPIKLKDGRVFRPTRKKNVEIEDEPEQDQVKEETKVEFEDFRGLSAVELLLKRKEMIQQFKQTISGYAHDLLTDPQDNIYRLRDLFQLCQGEKVHSLVRESVQKLALLSIMQALIDIIPGYSIRELNEEEKQQKVKKETKKVRNFEEVLLRYYLKFLQFCEKKMEKLNIRGRKLCETSFTYKLGMLCLKSMSRFVIYVPHFNYATNILSALIHLSLSNSSAVVSEVCNTLNQVFREDLHLRMSLFGARSIASLVSKRKGCVPPQLIATLLSLNIKEVKDESKKSRKKLIQAKRAKLKKERANKTVRKYKKQLDKLEADLKELDAAENLSTKLRTATETMRHVFQCYFSVLKRVPNVALLEPVLEGLSKFAHLLGVEFFEDIVSTMENLVKREGLRLLDRLYCINTVFIVLSGDGQLLNIDPSRFYRTIYRLINELPFERKPEVRKKQVCVAAAVLDLMVNDRRKQVFETALHLSPRNSSCDALPLIDSLFRFVIIEHPTSSSEYDFCLPELTDLYLLKLPLSRVAAFVKRVLSIATIMDDPSALCLVALVRSFFIAHPKLVQLVEEDDLEGGAGGVFRPDIDDPDVSNALSSNVRTELKILSRRRHRSLSQFAQNVLHSVPSTGPLRLNPQLTSVKPWILMEHEFEMEEHSLDVMKYVEDMRKNLKVRETL
ncbi:unnamed protein product [Angiostrongylus costaricensis]|uniref:NOC3-like protein n=1 Tax=Angiostrongylus costaricensis TaxID=334426 RepID=A0A158PFW0_ANGCS|nr:unnamed protein product [Angiostrongylus costaricensis]